MLHTQLHQSSPIRLAKPIATGVEVRNLAWCFILPGRLGSFPGTIPYLGTEKGDISKWTEPFETAHHVIRNVSDFVSNPRTEEMGITALGPFGSAWSFELNKQMEEKK